MRVSWGVLGPPSLELWLRRDGDFVVVTCDQAEGRVRLPRRDAEELRMRLTPRGHARGPGRAEDTSRAIAAVGARLAAALEGLPALVDLVAWTGARLLRFVADDVRLLGLPWEAAAVAGEAIGLIAGLGVTRELVREDAEELAVMPGPLKVLVAVATPDADPDAGEALELLYSAIEGACLASSRLVFLAETAATLAGLRERLDGEAFHVLHLSAPSRASALVLEDERGRPVEVLPEELAAALIGAEHPPGLVYLSALAGGGALESPGPMRTAMELYAAGLPRVLTMQGPSERVAAAELARHFYAALVSGEAVVPALALCEARRRVEHERRACADIEASDPAYASSLLFVARGQAMVPLVTSRAGAIEASPRGETRLRGLGARPADSSLGRVQLRRDVRQALVRRWSHGVLLVGEAGAGKSGLAASVASGLVREGWRVIVLVGAFAPEDLVSAAMRQLAGQLAGFAAAGVVSEPREDAAVLAAFAAVLQRERVILLLDEFEACLERGEDGAPLLLPSAGPRDCRLGRMMPTMAAVVPMLAAAAEHGALLVVCRHRVAELEQILTPLTVPPLSPLRISQWSRRALARLDAESRALALSELGDWPAAWELAEALVRLRSGWIAGGPGTIEARLIRALIAGLDVEARAVLAVVAISRRVLGVAAVVSMVRALAGVWSPEAMATLVARGLVIAALTDVGEEGWVVPQVVATWLHEQGPPSPELHAAAAEWWESRPQRSWTEGRDAILHWLVAGAPQRAIALAVQMGGSPVGGEVNAGFLRGLVEVAIAGAGTSLSDELRGEAVRVRVALGGLHERGGDLVQARDALVQALAEAEVQAQRGPGALLAQRFELCERLDELSRLLGDESGARRYYAAALRLAAQLGVVGPRKLRQAHRDHAAAGRDLDATEIAGRWLVESIALVRTIAGEPARRELCWLSWRHAAVLRARGELAAALAILDVDLDELAGVEVRVRPAWERLLGELRCDLGQSTVGHQHFESALRYARRLVVEEPDCVAHQRELAACLGAMGEGLCVVGDSEAGLRCFEDALGLARAVLVRTGEVDAVHDLWVACNRVARAHLRFGAEAAAAAWLAEGLRHGEAVRASESGRSDLQRTLLCAYDLQAELQRGAGELAASHRTLVTVCELAGVLMRREPKRLDLRRDHVRAQLGLADIEVRRGELAAARRRLTGLLEIAVVVRPEHVGLTRDRAAVYELLVQVYLQSDRKQVAAAVEAGMALTYGLLRRETERVDLQQDLAVWYGHLAGRELGHGAHREALEHLQASRELFDRLLAREPRRIDLQWGLVSVCTAEAQLFWALRDRLYAVRRAGRALAVAEAMVAQTPDSQQALGKLARVSLVGALMMPGHTLPLSQRAVALQRRRMMSMANDASVVEELAGALVELGKAWLQQDSSEGARAAYGEARGLYAGLGRVGQVAAIDRRIAELT